MRGMNKSVYFNLDLIEKIEKISKENNRSFSFIVNEAIKKYLKKEKKWKSK